MYGVIWQAFHSTQGPAIAPRFNNLTPTHPYVQYRSAATCGMRDADVRDGRDAAILGQSSSRGLAPRGARADTETPT